MATFLFDKIIFGPVHSRRLGISLGVNLLLPTAKLCNFDCIYCECGWNGDHRGGSFNTKEDVLFALQSKLSEMALEGELPNYITFAGNGEPTMHPNFLEIIDGTIALRNSVAPLAKIAVLTNATMIDREDVRAALLKIDRPILKFDSAIQSTVELINQPAKKRTVDQTIELLKLFGGQIIIQTMFIRGCYKGVTYDNTTPQEVAAWLDAIKEIAPREVMLYSIDRDTPDSGVRKVSREELEQIAKRVEALGITAWVSEFLRKFNSILGIKQKVLYKGCEVQIKLSFQIFA